MVDPYHAGEVAVQALTGQRSEAILNGRMIWTTIPAAARPFVSQQAMFAVGWQDAVGDVWAGVVGGSDASATCDEQGGAVTMQLGALGCLHQELRHGLADAHGLGMLFIDLSTRRRLRVNGVIERSTPDTLRLRVEQAFPNCPKYIQQRERSGATLPAAPPVHEMGVGVPAALPGWLVRTDTAFVASVGPLGDVDCSHRGGRPGFLRVEDGVIHIPDYPGNSMFCTLGNVAQIPRAGLTLMDFDRGSQLHLSGEAELAPSNDTRPGGTARWWSIRPRRWLVSSLPAVGAWHLVSASPFNPAVQS